MSCGACETCTCHQQEYVEITVEEYEALLEDSKMLYALEAAGVDNWDGYSEAQEILEQMEQEED